MTRVESPSRGGAETGKIRGGRNGRTDTVVVAIRKSTVMYNREEVGRVPLPALSSTCVNICPRRSDRADVTAQALGSIWSQSGVALLAAWVGKMGITTSRSQGMKLSNLGGVSCDDSVRCWYVCDHGRWMRWVVLCMTCSTKECGRTWN